MWWTREELLPVLIAMAGLPASGKSSLAKRLARALPATLLDKDSVRHFLFGTHVDYSGAQNDLVMGIAYEVSAYLHTQQRDIRILIDGRTFSGKHAGHYPENNRRAGWAHRFA